MLKTTSGEQTQYRALTRPFSLSEAEYAEMGVACETVFDILEDSWANVVCQ